ncbi:MAG: hypothetical protein II531_03345 [Bacteroidales bacterium]|nr:hypothetical protein [Bacteroidales bacterium]
MNRLSHFLRAGTQYNLHSPFVYNLYTEVLTAHVPQAPHNRYEDVVWRLEQRYKTTAERSADSARLQCGTLTFLVIDHPHRNEHRWQHLLDNPSYQVTIDLFSVGVVIANKNLSRQHFILR